MLEKVIEFVNISFEEAGRGNGIKHLEKTVYWIKQLKPDADEPILIAAYSHDIQRAFRIGNPRKIFKGIELNDAEFLRILHQEKGAAIISDFLKRNGYDEESRNRVYNMVRHHEDGGDEESDLLKDADSLSYFEVVADYHASKGVEDLGKKKIKTKFYWMYKRITSEQARKIAKPMYERALKLLETS